jgi:hypothetical protein
MMTPEGAPREHDFVIPREGVERSLTEEVGHDFI